MDDRTQADEARLRRQRDAGSATLDREVNAEITRRGMAADAAEAERLAAEAGRLDRLELDQRRATAAAATAEALASTRVRDRARERRRQVSGISRAVTYLFSLVYVLLLIRIVLALLGASPSTPFVRLINAVARPFHLPFEGIASTLTTNAEAWVVAPMVVAILVAALLHAAIMGLLGLFAPREIPQN
jgi:hypothetical protein